MAGKGGTGRRTKNTDGGPDLCATLGFETILQSPELNVLRRLVVGSILRLEIQKIGGYDTIVATIDAEIAGTIMSQIAGTLLGCMLQGHGYIATVQEIELPMCKVRISHI